MRPFEAFTVSYDGTVFPCCQLFVDNEMHRKLYSIGNLMDYSNIFEAYASTMMSKGRASLLRYGVKPSLCDSCNEANYAGTQDQAEEREVLFKNLVEGHSR
jgi:radical SAM protein with 4Fe4S-binding SPASM domain